jgi:hypothetical protein
MYTIHRSLSQLLVLGLYINTLFGDKQRSMFTVLLYEHRPLFVVTKQRLLNKNDRDKELCTTSLLQVTKE